MVSAKRHASSMPEIVDNTSLGTFLDSWTYCSKWPVKDRTSTSFSRSDKSGSTKLSAWQRNNSSSSINSTSLALYSPSTNTFTVPSGSLSNCKILATVPTWFKSLASGLSSLASFCATNMTRLSFAIASSNAAMDLALPTNKGITILGNTTTSRKGNNGR